MTQDLASLPVRNGFRMRGMSMTRMETFTDAAFAFAVSLLVLSNDPFTSFSDLRNALWSAPGFVFSMGILLIFWVGHRTFSRRYGLDDAMTIALSWLFVLVLLLYVFPLHFVGLTFYSWVLWQATGLMVPSSPAFDARQDLNTLFAIYSAGFTLMCLILAALFMHALRQRERLCLSEIERHDTRGSVLEWTILAATGAMSLTLSLVMPPSLLGVPGWVYMTLPIIMPVVGARHERVRKTLHERLSES